MSPPAPGATVGLVHLERCVVELQQVGVGRLLADAVDALCGFFLAVVAFRALGADLPVGGDEAPVPGAAAFVRLELQVLYLDDVGRGGVSAHLFGLLRRVRLSAAVTVSGRDGRAVVDEAPAPVAVPVEHVVGRLAGRDDVRVRNVREQVVNGVFGDASGLVGPGAHRHVLVAAVAGAARPTRRPGGRVRRRRTR